MILFSSTLKMNVPFSGPRALVAAAFWTWLINFYKVKYKIPQCDRLACSTLKTDH